MAVAGDSTPSSR